MLFVGLSGKGLWRHPFCRIATTIDSKEKCLHMLSNVRCSLPREGVSFNTLLTMAWDGSTQS